MKRLLRITVTFTQNRDSSINISNICARVTFAQNSKGLKIQSVL